MVVATIADGHSEWRECSERSSNWTKRGTGCETRRRFDGNDDGGDGGKARQVCRSRRRCRLRLRLRFNLRLNLHLNFHLNLNIDIQHQHFN